VTPPDPGRVLGRAIIAWGLGHLLLGRSATGRLLLLAEIIGILLVGWLTAALADTNLYLVPFVAGVLFLVVWGWQAVAAYRSAQLALPARPPTPERSPAAAIGWLSLPLLAWFTGFWLIGADAATPAASLDRFVSAWTADGLDPGVWPAAVAEPAQRAADALGTGADRFRDIRFTIVSEGAGTATAVADAIHYDRQPATFLGVFSGTELVPVLDQRILTIELVATPVELLGGGDIGAVRWELAEARTE
jgi:hypothetical protein